MTKSSVKAASTEQITTTTVQGNLEREIIPVVSTVGSAPPLSEPPPSSEEPNENSGIPPGQYKLVFLIRPFNGWTKRLRDDCLQAGPHGVANLKLLVEGPYDSNPSPVTSFENIIFVVGGTGISGAIPYLQEYIRLTTPRGSPNEQVRNTRNTRTRAITVIWAAKQSSMIRDIAAHELRPFLNRDDIHFKFYATREKKVAAATALFEKHRAGDLGILDHRPDIKATISAIINQVSTAGSRGGKIAIFTCGPAAMADEARLVAHQALKAGEQGLEYIEESFG